VLSKFEIRRLTLAAIFVVLLTLSLREIAPSPKAAADFSGSERGPEIILEIPAGATGSEVARLLYEKGVIASSLAFFRVAVSDERSARIAPGEHRVDTKISAREALEQLLEPDRILNLIRIRDGSRLTEVLSALKDVGFTNEQIKSALTEIRVQAPFNEKKLEGLLYPAFYSKSKTDTAKSLLQSMVNRFEASTQDLVWEYRDFKPYELLTIASLVESEGIPIDFPKVAQVIYNRLRLGMPLQFDSTVHYIFDRRGEIQLSLKDTQVKNPYNTFQNRGLPPGPIGSPTRAAIEATLNPESGPWLYFVTVLPKETKFTEDYEEFLLFKAEYKRNFASGKFE
jgi:UPF0755 protein